MEKVTLSALDLALLALVLLSSISCSIWFFFLYTKYKKKYYTENIWRILFEIKNKKEAIGIKEIEKSFESISENFRKSDLSLLEINQIKNVFFDIVDVKMTDRITPVMNLKNSTLPSLRDVFPKGYSDFPFNFFEKREDVSSLIREFEDFIELIDLKRDKISNFETKLNIHLPSILYSIKCHLDLDGVKEKTMYLYRRDSFVRTVRKLSEFSIVQEGKIIQILADIGTRDPNHRRIEEMLEPPQADFDKLEVEIFNEIHRN